MSAFLVAAFSSIMPISVLGVWCATLILFLFINVFAVFPAALVLHNRFLTRHDVSARAGPTALVAGDGHSGVVQVVGIGGDVGGGGGGDNGRKEDENDRDSNNGIKADIENHSPSPSPSPSLSTMNSGIVIHHHQHIATSNSTNDNNLNNNNNDIDENKHDVDDDSRRIEDIEKQKHEPSSPTTTATHTAKAIAKINPFSISTQSKSASDKLQANNKRRRRKFFLFQPTTTTTTAPTSSLPPSRPIDAVNKIFHLAYSRTIRPVHQWLVSHHGYTRERYIERWFHDVLYPILSRFRYVTFVSSLVLLAALSYQASRLQTPDESERMLPSSNAVQQILDVLFSSFAQSNVMVSVYFGISALNTSGASRFDSSFAGTVILDERFDFATRHTQLRMYDLCKLLIDQKDALHIATDLNDKPLLDCWALVYKDDMGLDFQDYNSSKQQVDDLLQLGRSVDPKTRLQPFSKFINGKMLVPDQQGSRIIYCELRAQTTMKLNAHVSELRRLRNVWKGILPSPSSSSSLADVHVSGGFAWSWMETQETLKKSLLHGSIIMICIASVVLTLTTRKLLESIISAFAIGGALICMIGWMRTIHIMLGTIEMICVVIASGYTFDGVAHMAKSFEESDTVTNNHNNNNNNNDDNIIIIPRDVRVRNALRHRGISVLMGGFTTIVATLFLFPGTLVFFPRFATMIVSAVAFGMLWSLLLFPTYLLVIDPEAIKRSVVCACFRARRSQGQEQEQQVPSRNNGNIDADADAETNAGTDRS